MSKSFRHYKNTSKGLRKLRRTRRKTSTKRKTQKMKAGNGDKVLCSMCEKQVPLRDTLIPRECRMKHGKAAHRICKDCWWDPKIGFALESSSHKCPGCEKELPLTPVKKEEPVLIDLTEE
jgi:hypothetical protein